MFTYRITEVIPIAEHATQIFLQPIDATSFSYEAGQYVEIIHHQHASPLSIACAPNEKNILEFHLFHPVKNPVARALLSIAHEKKIWTLQGPFGNCTLRRLSAEKPIIFLAQGTGFAPIKAIFEALLTSSLAFPAIHFYWSVANRQDIYLSDLLTSWQKQIANFTYTPVLTSGFSEKEKMNIHLLRDTILRDHPMMSDYQVYASGPKPLMQTTFLTFAQHGLQREFFYSDVF